MVSKKVTIAIATLLGFLLGVTVQTSIVELNEFNGIQLVGPIYFGPQLALIGGFAVICFYGIVYVLDAYTTIDK